MAQIFLVNNHYVGATGGKKYLNYDGHPGYDYPVPVNTEVYAAAEGTIHKAEWNVYPPGHERAGEDAGGGYYIKIKHNDGAYYTSYLHLTEFVKFKVWNEGEHVDKGQQIALSGDTAFTNKSTNAHLRG